MKGRILKKRHEDLFIAQAWEKNIFGRYRWVTLRFTGYSCTKIETFASQILAEKALMEHMYPDKSDPWLVVKEVS